MKPLVFTKPAQVLHYGHRYVCVSLTVEGDSRWRTG